MSTPKQLTTSYQAAQLRVVGENSKTKFMIPVKVRLTYKDHRQRTEILTPWGVDYATHFKSDEDLQGMNGMPFDIAPLSRQLHALRDARAKSELPKAPRPAGRTIRARRRV